MSTVPDQSLRIATRADVDAMADVFIAAWRSGYRGVVPDDVIDALDVDAVVALVQPGLIDADRTTVVAVRPDTAPDARPAVVGFSQFGPDRDAPADGYVASLYVHPDAAGHGVGRALLRYALDAMPGRDVTLWVFAANARARRLYERAGFTPDGAEIVDPRWRTPQIRMRRVSA
ncbi:MAG TPA: GNAT family N-acetyltransferase [Micromonosporaceae bacterium]